MNLRFLTSLKVCTHESSLQQGEAVHAEPWKAIWMRKVAYLVFFSYTLLMLKPVMPVVMDVLAHTFWEKQHLLSVHEVNGKFHVHYELARAEHQGNKEKTSGGYKFEVEPHAHKTLKIVYNHTGYSSMHKIYAYYTCYYPAAYIDIVSPPPKYFKVTIA